MISYAEWYAVNQGTTFDQFFFYLMFHGMIAVVLSVALATPLPTKNNPWMLLVSFYKTLVVVAFVALTFERDIAPWITVNFIGSVFREHTYPTLAVIIMIGYLARELIQMRRDLIRHYEDSDDQKGVAA